MLHAIRRPDAAYACPVWAVVLAELPATRVPDDEVRRRHSGSTGWVVWFAVVAGGAVPPAFVALLGTFNRAFHLGTGSLLTPSGTLVLAMIPAFSHPFRGDFRITPESSTAAVSQPAFTLPEEQHP